MAKCHYIDSGLCFLRLVGLEFSLDIASRIPEHAVIRLGNL